MQCQLTVIKIERKLKRINFNDGVFPALKHSNTAVFEYFCYFYLVIRKKNCVDSKKQCVDNNKTLLKTFV